MTNSYFKNCADTMLDLVSSTEIIKDMAREIDQLKNRKNKILIAGNGGSCADAEHFAGELLCTFKDRGRTAIPAVLLSNNASAINRMKGRCP